jgi:Tfp pilus assembly protein FimV
MAKTYHVEHGETLWNIAERTLPDMKRQDAVLELFKLNWEPLARRFWLPEGTELRMPAEFEPSGNEPFDPSAVTPRGKK